MKNKKELIILKEETRLLFLKTNIKPPERILPNIIFEWMKPIDCFKTRTRTLLSDIKTTRNFIVTDEGNILLDRESQSAVIVQNNEGYEKAIIIKEQIKKLSGIDIDVI